METIISWRYYTMMEAPEAFQKTIWESSDKNSTILYILKLAKNFASEIWKKNQVSFKEF